MGLAEPALFAGLVFISVWLGYLNFRILQITQDIHKLTISLDDSTTEIHTLTKEMVQNLREVVANTSFEYPNNPS
jgi:cell division protein FtsL